MVLLASVYNISTNGNPLPLEGRERTSVLILKERTVFDTYLT